MDKKNTVQGLYKNYAFSAFHAHFAYRIINNLQILKGYGANDSVSGHHPQEHETMKNPVVTRAVWLGLIPFVLTLFLISAHAQVVSLAPQQ